MTTREPPVAPPPTPASPQQAPAAHEPWPYEPFVGPWSTGPTWECPGGLCLCHPVQEEEEPREQHVIVFHDPQAKRMPGARCRVYEQGRLLTPDPTTTNGAGEISIEVRASTSTLRIEWAPGDLPTHQFLPYRKIYHLKMPGDRAAGAERRLSNIGFSRRRRRDDNVRDYQRAYSEEPTGNIHDIELEVLDRHDDGTLPVFHPQPPTGGASGPSPESRSFFGAPSRVAPDLAAEPRVALNTTTTPQQGGSGTTSGGQTAQGSVVPDAAHVAIMVALEPNARLDPANVTVRLRPRKKRPPPP